MRHFLALACAAAILCSCSNLFHHEVDPETAPPIDPPVEQLKINHVFPANNATDVDQDTSIQVVFSGEVDKTTVSDKTVIIQKISENTGEIRTRINGSLEVVNNGTGSVYFRMNNDTILEPQQKYCITVKRGIRGSQEKVLENDFESTFTTGGTVVPPEVLLNVDQVMPADDATGVPCNTGIQIFFSDELDKTTISAQTVIIQKIEEEPSEVRTRISGNLEIVNNEKGYVNFTLDDEAAFEARKKYCITVKQGIRGSHNNVLENDFVSTFTTGGAVDATSPLLVSVSPEYLVDANNAPITSVNIIIRFNEAISSSTLSDIRLYFRNLNEDGAFDYKIFTDVHLLDNNSIIIVADFNPDSLTVGKYEIELDHASDINDLSGNPFMGTVKQNINYLEIFKHPSQTPCFLGGEDAECCQ